jgi:hypothetical protein
MVMRQNSNSEPVSGVNGLSKVGPFRWAWGVVLRSELSLNFGVAELIPIKQLVSVVVNGFEVGIAGGVGMYSLGDVTGEVDLVNGAVRGGHYELTPR